VSRRSRRPRGPSPRPKARDLGRGPSSRSTSTCQRRSVRGRSRSATNTRRRFGSSADGRVPRAVADGHGPDFRRDRARSASAARTATPVGVASSVSAPPKSTGSSSSRAAAPGAGTGIFPWAPSTNPEPSRDRPRVDLLDAEVLEGQGRRDDVDDGVDGPHLVEVDPGPARGPWAAPSPRARASKIACAGPAGLLGHLAAVPTISSTSARPRAGGPRLSSDLDGEADAGETPLPIAPEVHREPGQSERAEGRAQVVLVGAGVHQGPDDHVPGDPAERVEDGDPHGALLATTTSAPGGSPRASTACPSRTAISRCSELPKSASGSPGATSA
jgi:hypothetical protein